MAERRMFAKTIIDSDAFLDMPLSSQALYFHLNMRADDDGFINNPRKIQRMLGCSDDDLKLLLAKRFAIGFESGVIVIKHWRMHNTLSVNRYKETNFLEDKALLKIKANKSYTLGEGEVIDDTKLIESGKRQTIDKQKTSNRQAIDKQKTNTDKNRIDKNSIDKNSIDKNRVYIASEEATPAPKVKKHKFGKYKHVLLSDEDIEKLKHDIGEEMTNKTVVFLDEYIEEKGYKSKSHNLAIRRWVIDAVKENEAKTGRYPSRRKEPVPGWCKQTELGNAEMEAIQRVLREGQATVGNSPELADRAEQLKQRLME
jgi:hypothetical protein